MSNDRCMSTAKIPGRSNGGFVSADLLHLVTAICRDGMLTGSYIAFRECESKIQEKVCPESSTLLLSDSTGLCDDEGKGHKKTNNNKKNRTLILSTYIFLSDTVLVEQQQIQQVLLFVLLGTTSFCQTSILRLTTEL